MMKDLDKIIASLLILSAYNLRSGSDQQYLKSELRNAKKWFTQSE